MEKQIYQLINEYKNTRISIGNLFEIPRSKNSYETRVKTHISKKLPAANSYQVTTRFYSDSSLNPSSIWCQAYFVPQLADQETQRNFYRHIREITKKLVCLENKFESGKLNARKRK